jgi:transglutaminase-like putative cysteine protease
VSMRRSLRTFALELATFAALAWYTAAHWASGLVADAPGGRVFACVVIAVAVGVVLTLADTAPRAQAWALRVGGILAGLGAGFVAIGLDAKYLAPAHWDELGDGLDRGFTALGSAQWPYGGAESWATLALLLAIPLVLTTAAAFAFWPSRSLRPFAVVLLVALFAFAVTEHRFEGELARGVGLLFFAAAWLWLPRMPDRGARTATAAAGAVLVACLAALPAAATYDDRDPLIDYQSWNPFAAHATTRFDWSHDYGPIDWPRDGTTLMYVKAAERNYWKLETLGAFVEDHWVRSGFGRGNNPILPEPYNVASETDLRVTIADLDTDVIPIAGTALQITGVDSGVLPTEDGTVEALEERPEEGDTYFVKAYVPDPTPLEMRAAPPDVPNALLEYTEVGHLAPAYDRVADLAARLARGEPTKYDVVRAVQEHLRTEYGYNERPPDRRYPLPAFLFRDRIGYCQHFSGAMALMLRTLGIPARVAAGFTPGSYNADTKEYRVRDLDAHSWIDVWFEGIGWVPFDPTPSVAPAEAQSDVNAASASGGPAAAGEVPDVPAAPDTASPADGGRTEGGAHPGGAVLETWMAFAAIALLAVAGLAALGALRLLPHRSGMEAEEAEIAALRRVLSRAGEPAASGLTLQQLERRLERAADPAATRYLRMLRERRYGPDGGRMPDGAARRHLRRALVRGRGLRARLAALLAMPPLSFRRG